VWYERRDLPHCITISVQFVQYVFSRAVSCLHIFEEILCHIKNTNRQQMHKESFIISCNTLLHVSTLLGHLQGELCCYCYTKVALYSWVRMCCWLCTALFLEAWTLCGPGLQACRLGPQRVHASSTQYTVNSTFSLNYKVQP
jgi:hypothetical protein